MKEFQEKVALWVEACFGPEIAQDRLERNHRFIEEALELAQSRLMTKEEAHQLVDYVFDRPVGEPFQELGGVMITLAALTNTDGFNMEHAGLVELKRCYDKIAAIREKQANKPAGALPQ